MPSLLINGGNMMMLTSDDFPEWVGMDAGDGRGRR